MAAPYSEYGAAPYDEYTASPAEKAAKQRINWGAQLRRPITFGAAARGLGAGVMAAGRTLWSPAAAIPTAAGMTASTMAGAGPMAGADPMMFMRALGEGYARRMPTWLGGASAESIAAGDMMGAGDIEGRFGVAPAQVAPVAPAPMLPSPALPAQVTFNDGTVTGGGVDPASFARTTVPFRNAPVAPWSAADVRGARIPERGTGAFMNNGTGAVTMLDTRAQSGYGVEPAPTSPVAGFVGAMLGLKQIAGTEATKTARAKLELGAVDNVAKAGQVANATRIAARIADSATTSEERTRLQAAAGALFGRVAPTEAPNVFLPSVTGNDMIVGNKATGGVQIKTPIRPVTEADIKTTMAGQKMTRAQVLEALRARGADLSGIK